MTKTAKNKTIAVILAITLFLEMILSPVIVMGYDKDPQEEPATNQELREAKVTEKGENYTIFEHADGTETLQMYTGDVRVEGEDGKLEDIDNTLEKKVKDGETIYTNVNGFVDVTLPETLSADKPICVENGAESIMFLPIFGKANIKEAASQESPYIDKSTTEGIAQDSVDVDENAVEAESVSLEKTDIQEAATIIEVEGVEELLTDTILKDEVTDLYNQTEEKQTGIRYETPDSNVFIEYIPIDSGVKENIILEANPDSNVFSFVIKAKGQYLEKQQRGIVFKDINTGKVKGTIQEPFMTDSSNTENQGYSEELEYSINTLDEDKGIYRVDLTVSKDYLTDKDRVYPVIIDPHIRQTTKINYRMLMFLVKKVGQTSIVAE
ncbi:MAG TPA: hypothetical protein GX736_02355 [Mogibacterium sp.]|nr:hypothetical protein [Mogibacterium sp.]